VIRLVGVFVPKKIVSKNMCKALYLTTEMWYKLDFWLREEVRMWSSKRTLSKARRSGDDPALNADGGSSISEDIEKIVFLSQ
jgi:hypothetical protein